jgi:hypothetical protein
VLVAYFKVVSQNLSGGSEENHENPAIRITDIWVMI